MSRDLKPGDRVQMTEYGINQGLGTHGNKNKPCYGTVIKINEPLGVRVLRDGTKQPRDYHHIFWRKSKAARNTRADDEGE